MISHPDSLVDREKMAHCAGTQWISLRIVLHVHTTLAAIGAAFAALFTDKATAESSKTKVALATVFLRTSTKDCPYHAPKQPLSFFCFTTTCWGC